MTGYHLWQPTALQEPCSSLLCRPCCNCLLRCSRPFARAICLTTEVVGYLMEVHDPLAFAAAYQYQRLCLSHSSWSWDDSGAATQRLYLHCATCQMGFRCFPELRIPLREGDVCDHGSNQLSAASEHIAAHARAEALSKTGCIICCHTLRFGTAIHRRCSSCRAVRPSLVLSSGDCATDVASGVRADTRLSSARVLFLSQDICRCRGTPPPLCGHHTQIPWLCLS